MPAEPGNSPPIQVLTLYNFKASHNAQLSFEKGEKLTLLEKQSEGGWWIVRRESTNEVGLIPYNYVKELDLNESNKKYNRDEEEDDDDEGPFLIESPKANKNKIKKVPKEDLSSQSKNGNSKRLVQELGLSDDLIDDQDLEFLQLGNNSQVKTGNNTNNSEKNEKNDSSKRIKSNNSQQQEQQPQKIVNQKENDEKNKILQVENERLTSEFEEYKKAMCQEIEGLKIELGKLKEENQSLINEKDKFVSESNEKEKLLVQKIGQKWKVLLEKWKTEAGNLQTQNDAMIIEKETLENSKKALESDINVIKEENNRMRTQIVVLKEENSSKNEKMSLEMLELRTQISKFQDLSSENQRLAQQNQAIALRLKNVMKKRTQLFNEIQEMRGNIRVYVRVRPFLVNEIEEEKIEKQKLDNNGGKPAIFVNPEGDVIAVHDEYHKKDQQFEFERVFAGDSTQEEVYEEVSAISTCVADGFNACIFAYGQTGSGKTYTMEGTEQNPGINYRTIRDIFEIKKEREQNEFWDYQVYVSCIEIYKEQLFDLFSNSERKVLDKILLSGGVSQNLLAKKNGKKAHLKQKNICPKVEIPGLSKLKVENIDSVYKYLETALKSRITHSNNVNEKSSRSHCILTVYVEGYNRVLENEKNSSKNAPKFSGKLHLIDLAGSEKPEKTINDDELLKETKFINSSLSTLYTVIKACEQNTKISKKYGNLNYNAQNLTDDSNPSEDNSNEGLSINVESDSKSPFVHVPYRNSKLTSLLQDSLGGDSKMLMIVNITPCAKNAGESINSLSFGATAKKVEVAKKPPKSPKF